MALTRAAIKDHGMLASRASIFYRPPKVVCDNNMGRCNRSLSKLRLRRKGICSNKNGVKNLFSGFPPVRE
jgi:hypothetical protein